jgi:hypothetical protein
MQYFVRLTTETFFYKLFLRAISQPDNGRNKERNFNSCFIDGSSMLMRFSYMLCQT